MSEAIEEIKKDFDKEWDKLSSSLGLNKRDKEVAYIFYMGGASRQMDYELNRFKKNFINNK